jgi:hypothetical protein
LIGRSIGENLLIVVQFDLQDVEEQKITNLRADCAIEGALTAHSQLAARRELGWVVDEENQPAAVSAEDALDDSGGDERVTNTGVSIDLTVRIFLAGPRLAERIGSGLLP